MKSNATVTKTTEYAGTFLPMSVLFIAAPGGPAGPVTDNCSSSNLTRETESFKLSCTQIFTCNMRPGSTGWGGWSEPNEEMKAKSGRFRLYL